MQLVQNRPAPRFYVYALFCQEDGQHAYVKIGRSENILSRISTLRTTCPVPARFFAYIEVESFGKSVTLEAKLHERFKDKHSTGEWFKLNLLDPEERQYFNDNCRWVFAKFFKSDNAPFWESVDIEAYDAEDAERRRRRFWTTPKGRKLAARKGQQGRDATEFKNYRKG